MPVAASLKRRELRLCNRCGEPAISSRHWYCGACQIRAEDKRAKRKKPIPTEQRLRERQAARKSQPSSEAMGYGARHRAERQRWAPRVAAGGVICARAGCGRLIERGASWDMGHVDGSNKTEYAGPEHRKCNRATAGRMPTAGRQKRSRSNSRKWL